MQVITDIRVSGALRFAFAHEHAARIRRLPANTDWDEYDDNTAKNALLLPSTAIYCHFGEPREAARWRAGPPKRQSELTSSITTHSNPTRQRGAQTVAATSRLRFGLVRMSLPRPTRSGLDRVVGTGFLEATAVKTYRLELPGARSQLLVRCGQMARAGSPGRRRAPMSNHRPKTRKVTNEPNPSQVARNSEPVQKSELG